MYRTGCGLDIYENLVFLFVLKSQFKYFPREAYIVIVVIGPIDFSDFRLINSAICVHITYMLIICGRTVIWYNTVLLLLPGQLDRTKNNANNEAPRFL